MGTIGAIYASNAAAYTLSGTCVTSASDNSASEIVTVTVGGVSLQTNPTCSSNQWTATFNLSAVGDGLSLPIIASYKSAPNATGSVLKDVVVPTLTLSTPPNADRITDSTYTLSGTCSENGRFVSIVARDSESTANEVTSQVNCSGSQWQKAMDITSLQAGTLNLTVSHTDLAGNGASATSTATRTDEVILTLTDPSDIGEDNEDSYSVSGTCSQEGNDITLSVGSVSPHSAPTCTNLTWEVTGLDVRSLTDGAVIITATHDGVTKTESILKNCVPGGGDGASAQAPIIICTYENLNNMRNDLTGGNIVKHYALGASIDARSSWDDHSSQASCTPYDGTTIASSTPCAGFPPLPKLKSSFDGKGYAISNLYIHKEGDHVGLFSAVGAEGVAIKNLHLKSIRVHNTKTSGTRNTGGMMGRISDADVIIDESSVTGEISGSGSVGGISGIGGNFTVKNSYTDVTATGTQWVGGIIGVLGGGSSIDNSHSRGSVTRTGSGYGGSRRTSWSNLLGRAIYNSLFPCLCFRSL